MAGSEEREVKLPVVESGVIALMTDFGADSYYVSVMKGVILSINPRVRIIDITHGIAHQGVVEGAFVLSGSYRYFPKGTVFVVVVDPGVGSKRSIICIKTRDYTFLAPDNGVLAMVKGRVLDIINVSNRSYFLKNISATFHGRDIMAPCAAYLARGLSPQRLGRRIKRIKKLNLPGLKIKNRWVQGEIIFADSFGNLVSNIPESLIKKLVKSVDYDKLKVSIRGKSIRGVRRFYAEASKGVLMALIGSAGYLEIARNQGSAEKYLKVKHGSQVVIEL